MPEKKMDFREWQLLKNQEVERKRQAHIEAREQRQTQTGVRPLPHLEGR